MPDTQPKPTAADVLMHHARDAAHGCISCGALPIGSSFAQHQADMLAAAGRLAAAEHDAQVAAQALRDAAGALMRFDCLTDHVPAGIDVPDDYEAGMNDAGGLLIARADRIAGRP